MMTKPANMGIWYPILKKKKKQKSQKACTCFVLVDLVDPRIPKTFTATKNIQNKHLKKWIIIKAIAKCPSKTTPLWFLILSFNYFTIGFHFYRRFQEPHLKTELSLRKPFRALDWVGIRWITIRVTLKSKRGNDALWKNRHSSELMSCKFPYFWSFSKFLHYNIPQDSSSDPSQTSSL